MPQLDGLRALAVTIVVVTHFLPAHPDVNVHAVACVHLFFVLSGYLITLILLKCRDDMMHKQASLREVMAKFYVRRVLRIFPVYYAALIGVSLTAAAPADHMLWHYLYLSNFLFWWINDMVPPLSHFWTLGVEEQFYLLWPMMVLLCPVKRLSHLCLLAIFIAPAFRLAGEFAGLSDIGRFILPLSCLDKLGIGALLAVLRWEGREAIIERFMPTAGAVGGVLTVLCFAVDYLGFRVGPYTGIQLCHLPHALLGVWMVDRAAKGSFGGLFGSMLSCSPALFIGRISYGIYVYHFLMLGVTGWMIQQGWIANQASVVFVVALTLTMVTSVISWYCMERPLVSLKARYDYHRKQ
jgi:peptidoglycan/LPS O-acetylase OafA/YrhL